MALLNKLFFPSSTSTTPSPSNAAATTPTVLTTDSQTAQPHQLSRTSSLASILTSNVAGVTSTIAGTTSSAAKSGGSNKKSNSNQTTHSKNYLRWVGSFFQRAYLNIFYSWYVCNYYALLLYDLYFRLQNAESSDKFASWTNSWWTQNFFDKSLDW